MFDIGKLNQVSLCACDLLKSRLLISVDYWLNSMTWTPLWYGNIIGTVVPPVVQWATIPTGVGPLSSPTGGKWDSLAKM